MVVLYFHVQCVLMTYLTVKQKEQKKSDSKGN